jgi:aspartate-semialdehyde dehydrogenase
VPASDGHLAAAFVQFERKPDRAENPRAVEELGARAAEAGLPSAPQPFLTYFEDESRPQTRLDRDLAAAWAWPSAACARTRSSTTGSSACRHNTVRGAAGGAILTAELLAAEGWLQGR